MDKATNDLLKWSIENSDVSREGGANAGISPDDARSARGRPLNADALKALMGGPSDAELMKEAMAVIQSDATLENKLIAFDNFEQMIETIDNANNMQNLGLWTPLVEQLKEQEPDLRRMAAWCLGTAVQNNVAAQERVSKLSFALSPQCPPYPSPSRHPRPKSTSQTESGVRPLQRGAELSASARCRDRGFASRRQAQRGDRSRGYGCGGSDYG